MGQLRLVKSNERKERALSMSLSLDGRSTDLLDLISDFKKVFYRDIMAEFKVSHEDMEDFGFGSLWVFDLGVEFNFRFTQEPVILTIKMK